MPSRFSLWVVQNWSSMLGPGWSPRSSTIPESFFRTFHICPDHWTIRVSIEYNKPRSSGQPVGLRETERKAFSLGKNGNIGLWRWKYRSKPPIRQNITLESFKCHHIELISLFCTTIIHCNKTLTLCWCISNLYFYWYHHLCNDK